jgi:AraC-like DNA-binding protein
VEGWFVSNFDIVQCRQFTTNRPPEQIRVDTFRRLPGVEFWSVSNSTRRWSMHHDTFTATLMLGSSLEARWHSRGLQRKAGSGSTQLMEPGEVSRTLHTSKPFSFFMMCWSAKALQRAGAELGIVGAPRFRRAQVDDSGLAVLLQRLQTSVCAADGSDIEPLYVESMRRLLELAAEPPSCAVSHCGHPQIRHARSYLHEFFPDTIPLDVLARRAKLSKFHFARSFRAATGLAPHQYQTLLRLQSARRLLEGGASVERAAAHVGFVDAPHLTRMFRNWLGVAPGAWARGGQTRDALSEPRLEPKKNEVGGRRAFGYSRTSCATL